jgi:hypothetical protein
LTLAFDVRPILTFNKGMTINGSSPSRGHFVSPSRLVFVGDTLGLLLNVETQELVFYLNGEALAPNNELFQHARFDDVFVVEV